LSFCWDVHALVLYEPCIYMINFSFSFVHTLFIVYTVAYTSKTCYGGAFYNFWKVLGWLFNNSWTFSWFFLLNVISSLCKLENLIKSSFSSIGWSFCVQGF
jgi:hypothetical protein